jgi:hypothetical protein
MSQKLHDIPTKMTAYWIAEHRCVLDEWANYFVTLAEFKEAVMVKGLAASKQHGGRAWVVDSRNARGVFPEEVQQYIANTCFQEFMKAGVKFFITIRSKSASTNLGIQRYEKQAGPAGIQLVTVESPEAAFEFLEGVDSNRIAA